MLRQIKPTARRIKPFNTVIISRVHSNQTNSAIRCLRTGATSSPINSNRHSTNPLRPFRYSVTFEQISYFNSKSAASNEEKIEQENPNYSTTQQTTPIITSTPTSPASTPASALSSSQSLSRVRLLLSRLRAAIARFLPFANSSSSLKSQASTSPSSSLKSSQSLTLSVDSQNRTLRFAFIGNLTITTMKLIVFALTNSQAMFAEFIHTFIDSVNQGFLLFGAREAMKRPDHRHQMGYGRAPYFWSLVSALNIFWIGVVFNSYHTLFHSSADMTPHWYTWLVLALSFTIDGAVLKVALTELNRNRPAGKSQWKHWKNLKNPLIIGTIMEDFAAVTGVTIAAAGIGLSHLTGNHIYDHVASLSISALLLYTSYTLIRTNYAYLLGFSLSPTLQANITQMIASRPSIQSVYSVRGEWIASDQFAFRCEIDFDGSYFSARLEENYREKFKQAIEKDKQEELAQKENITHNENDPASKKLDLTQPSETTATITNNSDEKLSLVAPNPNLSKEALYRFAPQFITYPPIIPISEKPSHHLSKLLALFAEDVTRLVEEEVVSIEHEIRSAYPQAAFIELEPASHSSLKTNFSLGTNSAANPTNTNQTVFNFRLVKEKFK